MKNRLIIILIILAAIFPFAATTVELAKDQLAALALAVLTLIALAIPISAMLYRPKRSAEADIPAQIIPTVRQAARSDGSPSGAPTTNTPHVSTAGAPPVRAANPADTKKSRPR